MNLKNPRLVGFGISNYATYSAAAEYASGAIIGSKFVQMLGETASAEEAVSRLTSAISA